MPVPKVLLIHTGGTLGMPLNDKSHQPLKPAEIRQAIVSPLDFLKKIAEIDVDVLVNLDSSDLQPSHWQELARRIEKNITKYQGVVIIHGTDTLAWTSTALSLMLSGLPIPVVLTGSQRPLEALRSDGRRNLLNAVEIAAKGPPGVMVVFGDRIFHGASVTKDSIFHFDAFRSNNLPSLGRIGLDITWQNVPKSRRRFWIDTRLETRVGYINVYPGMSPDWIPSLFKKEFKALVIEAFGSGNVPLGENSWENILSLAHEEKLPLVITSSCRHGLVNPNLYIGGQTARQNGAAFAFGMTREAVVIKTMMLLGRRVSKNRFVKEFEKNWCGEIGQGEML